MDAWKQQFSHLPLACIGKITAGETVVIRDKTGARPLNVHGYDHFA